MNKPFNLAARLPQPHPTITRQRGPGDRPPDLSATLYAALGFGPNPEYHDRLGRPLGAIVQG